MFQNANLVLVIYITEVITESTCWNLTPTITIINIAVGTILMMVSNTVKMMLCAIVKMIVSCVTILMMIFTSK